MKTKNVSKEAIESNTMTKVQSATRSKREFITSWTTVPREMEKPTTP